MAHTSGTASNYLDLLDRFITFVTTGLDSGQNWTVLKDSAEGANDRTVYFQAPGLAGTDQIFMQAAAFHNASADHYNLGFWGATAFNGTFDFYNQPGLSPGAFMFGWNSAIPYWFVGNGRCAKIVAKVATVYESAYMGLILPYGTPAEYPYPLFVGATYPDNSQGYSVSNGYHRAFWNPSSNGSGGLGGCSGTYLRAPGGMWLPVGNCTINNDSGGALTEALRIWPYKSFEQIGRVLGAPDYSLMPLVLHTGAEPGNPTMWAQRANYGELEGVYFVSGFANASENIVTVDSIDHLVVQNCYRTTAGVPNVSWNEYAAFALN